MRKEFVMRGQTAGVDTSPATQANEEVLNFGKYKEGYAYKLVEFSLYPSTGIGSNHDETCGTITAGKTAVNPTEPNFNNEGLIGTAMYFMGAGSLYPWGVSQQSVVNDTFLITQNLILKVVNANSATPVNWQCRFESVKMTGPEEAATNFKQFTISDA